MQKILKKILDELSSETPDISRVKGMLEVLIMEDEPANTPKAPEQTRSVANVKEVQSLDTEAKVRLNGIFKDSISEG